MHARTYVSHLGIEGRRAAVRAMIVVHRSSMVRESSVNGGIGGMLVRQDERRKGRAGDGADAQCNKRSGTVGHIGSRNVAGIKVPSWEFTLNPDRPHR